MPMTKSSIHISSSGMGDFSLMISMVSTITLIAFGRNDGRLE
jgi:hypothetical protein